MPKQLLESDFLTVDLGSVLKQQKVNKQDKPMHTDTSTDTATNSKSITNWGDELKARLKANSNLSPESRETEYEIETQFFKEFFEANDKWDAECVKQLISIGEPLKKLIKIIGFDVRANPILAFLSDDNFVIPILLKTKLLNATTFRAVYSAIAKRLVAASQFSKPNDYNIIYCPDLYTKSADEVLAYLKLQNDVLAANSSSYTKETQATNKRVFLALPNNAGKDTSELLVKVSNTDVSSISVQNLKLNSLSLAKELCNGLDVEINETEEKTVAKPGSANYKKLVRKLNTPEKQLAAILFLSLTTNSNTAKEALLNKKFSGVSKENLVKATAQIAGDMPKERLTTEAVDRLVAMLVSD